MYIKIHNDKQYDNCGSCSALIDYLEKENEDLGLNDRRLYFNNEGDSYSPLNVQFNIDENKGRLGKNETKFYTLSINPSQNELKYIANIATLRKVDSISQFTPSELKAYEQEIKNYVNNVMEIYANNFYRVDSQTKELKNFTSKDLVYYCKIEHSRSYGRDSNEVREGLKKVGEAKEGLQTHVHVVVSRMDKEQKNKLSPLATAKNSSIKLNGENVQVGFYRKDFFQKCETAFDSQFHYKRSINQSFHHRNVMKNFTSTLATLKNLEKFPTDPIKTLQASFVNNSVAKECLKAITSASTPVTFAVEATKKVVETAKKVVTTIPKYTIH